MPCISYSAWKCCTHLFYNYCESSSLRQDFFSYSTDLCMAVSYAFLVIDIVSYYLSHMVVMHFVIMYTGDFSRTTRRSDLPGGTWGSWRPEPQSNCFSLHYDPFLLNFDGLCGLQHQPHTCGDKVLNASTLSFLQHAPQPSRLYP